MPQKKFCKFLNNFALTQLKDYIKEKHKKEVKNQSVRLRITRLSIKDLFKDLSVEIKVLNIK